MHRQIDTASGNALAPYPISPLRQVPSDIPRPEYVGRKRVRRYDGPNVQPPQAIEAMRVAGRLAAQALELVGKAVAPGVTTDELDRVGHEFLVSSGAYPSTLTYPGSGSPPYPKSLC